MSAKINPSKAFASIIDNGVFFIAAAVLFLKTSEVLALFAPSTILGYSNIGWLYGGICALLVEGVLIASKYTLPSDRTGYAWLYNVMLIVVTFSISAAAQITDGFMVKQTLADQPVAIQFIVNWGVPLVPSIVLALVLGKTIFATLPEDAAPKTAKPTYKPAAAPETAQYAAESHYAELRRSDLSAEDKDFIATHNTRQILGKFGGSGRRAREWRNLAKRGEL